MKKNVLCHPDLRPPLPKLTEITNGSNTHYKLEGYPDTSNNHPGMLAFPFPLESHNERVILGKTSMGFGVAWRVGKLLL